MNDTHNFLYCEYINDFLSYFDLNKDPWQVCSCLLSPLWKTQLVASNWFGVNLSSEKMSWNLWYIFSDMPMHTLTTNETILSELASLMKSIGSVTFWLLPVLIFRFPSFDIIQPAPFICDVFCSWEMLFMIYHTGNLASFTPYSSRWETVKVLKNVLTDIEKSSLSSLVYEVRIHVHNRQLMWQIIEDNSKLEWPFYRGVLIKLLALSFYYLCYEC